MKDLTQSILIFYISCLFLAVFGGTQAYAKSKTFTPQQVNQDFDVLYQSLIDTHYNPFAYISEADFRTKYLSIKAKLNKPEFTLLETTTLFQQLTAAIKNGHTHVQFPVTTYMEYAEAGGSLFPLELAFEDGKAYVRANHSNNNQIMIGSELLTINGQAIDNILANIYPQISAERHYFANAILEAFTFPRYYWYAMGPQDSFDVELKTNGILTKYSLKAVPVMDGFEAKKDEILGSQPTVKFYGNTAYLNPGAFSGNEKKYQAFIDSAFAEINAKQSVNLIIDLKNNSGGNDSFSDYMVAYIADKPFQWSSNFYLRTSARLKKHTKANRDLTNPFWQSAIDNKDGEQYLYKFDDVQPVAEDKRYKGNVYVLVNRQSHSQSSVTAAQLQDYGWATIVGEETGDYPTLYASQFEYALPSTGIVVKISKGYIVRVNGSKKAEGVMPDIRIEDHLLDKNDEVLKGLLNQLEQL
ncbi:MAG: S41 family peptidase [Kangiellaceae bacterium]|jgi:hypothetical protein|nr:S41 family peptidase [Kangiellaceae bacterium]